MTYQVPRADIEVEKVEVRTANNGTPYFLITDSMGEMYGDWREDDELLGDKLEVGNKYGIEYTVSKCGNYKNVKSAWRLK